MRAWLRSSPLLVRLFGWNTRRRLWLGARRRGHVLARRLLVAPMDWVARAMGIQFVIPGNPIALGHQMVEPMQVLKESALTGSRTRFIFLVNKRQVANRFLLRMWEQQYHFIHVGPRRERALMTCVERFAPRSLRYVYCEGKNRVVMSRVVMEYAGPLLLRFPETDARACRATLERMGIPAGAWFVCVQAREPGFRPHLKYHVHRDSDIFDFIPAMEHIVSRGGYVVRVGESTTRPLPPIRGVVDYAHHALKHDAMDMYLFAHCRFFWGTSSGPITVAQAFDRPLAAVDMIAFTDVDILPDTLYIPKRIILESERRHLTFAEIHRRGIHRFWDARQFQDAGLRVCGNSSDEMRDLIREMLDRLDRRAEYLPEDLVRQERWNQLLTEFGFPAPRRPRVGRDFLRKYPELLEPTVALS